MTPDTWLRVNHEGIPDLLKNEAAWLVWTLNAGKKEPRSAVITERRIDATNPVNYARFEDACQAFIKNKHVDGIGFGLGPRTSGLHFSGIDLDDCRDPLTGAMEPWALTSSSG